VKLKIEVTYEDIDLGQPGDPHRCPIARAATRALGADAVVVVGIISLPHGPPITLPKEAHEFYLEFDEYHPVAPFTFEVEAP
jgi:hypothetical protein